MDLVKQILKIGGEWILLNINAVYAYCRHTVVIPEVPRVAVPGKEVD